MLVISIVDLGPLVTVVSRAGPGRRLDEMNCYCWGSGYEFLIVVAVTASEVGELEWDACGVYFHGLEGFGFAGALE